MVIFSYKWSVLLVFKEFLINVYKNDIKRKEYAALLKKIS